MQILDISQSVCASQKWEELPRVAGCARSVHGTEDDNERNLGGAGHHCASEKGSSGLI